MKEVGFVVTEDHIFSNGELFSSNGLQIKIGNWIEADFDRVQHTCSKARKIKAPLATLPYKDKDFLFIAGYRIGDETVRPFGKLADSGLDTSGYNKNDLVTAVFTLTTTGVVKLYKICFSHQAIFKAKDAIPVKLEEEKEDDYADLEKIMAGPPDKAPVTKKKDPTPPTNPEKKTHTKAAAPTFTKKKAKEGFGFLSSEDESEFVQKSRPSKRSVKAPLPPNPPSKPENEEKVKSNVDATKKSGLNRTTPDVEYIVPQYNGRKLSDGSDASFLLNPTTQILSSSSQSSDSDKDIEVVSKPKDEDWRTNFKKQFPEDFDFRDSGSDAESEASGVFDENAQIGYSDFEEDVKHEDFLSTVLDGDENEPKVPEPRCVKDAAFTSKVYDSSSEESSADVPKTIEPMPDESLLFDGKKDKRKINPTKIAENQEFMNDEIAWEHVYEVETLVNEELLSAKKHLIVHKFPLFIITFNTWDRNFGVIWASNNPDVFQDIKIGEIYVGKMGDIFDCVSKNGMPPLEYYLTNVSRRVKHNAVVWKNAIFDANVQIDCNSKEVSYTPIFAVKPCKIRSVRSFDNNFMVLEIETSKSKSVPTIIFPAKYMSIIQDYKNVGVLGTLQYYVHPKVNYYWSYVGEFFVFRNGEYNSVYIGEEDSFAAYLKQPQFWDWVRSVGGVKYEHPSRLDYNVEGSPLIDRKRLVDIPNNGQHTVPPPCSSDDYNIDAAEYSPDDKKIDDDDYPHFPEIPKERCEEPTQKQNVIRQNPVIHGLKLPRNVRLIKPRPPRQEDTQLKEYLAKFAAKENRTLLQQPFQHQPNIEDQHADYNPQHMLPQGSSNLDYSAVSYSYQPNNDANYQHDNFNAYPEMHLPKGLSRRLPAAHHQHPPIPLRDFLHNDYPAVSYSYQPNNNDNYQHDTFNAYIEDQHSDYNPQHMLPHGSSNLDYPAESYSYQQPNNDDNYQHDNFNAYPEVQLPKGISRRLPAAHHQHPPIPLRDFLHNDYPAVSYSYQPNNVDNYQHENTEIQLPKRSSHRLPAAHHQNSPIPPLDYRHNDYPAESYSYQPNNDDNYQHDNFNAYPEIHLPKGPSHRLPAAHHQHPPIPLRDFLHNDYPAESYSYQPNNDDNYQHENTEIQLPKGLPRHISPAAYQSPPVPPRTSSQREVQQQQHGIPSFITPALTDSDSE